jgi:hypothetical protein
LLHVLPQCEARLQGAWALCRKAAWGREDGIGQRSTLCRMYSPTAPLDQGIKGGSPCNASTTVSAGVCAAGCGCWHHGVWPRGSSSASMHRISRPGLGGLGGPVAQSVFLGNRSCMAHHGHPNLGTCTGHPAGRVWRRSCVCLPGVTDLQGPGRHHHGHSGHRHAAI